MAADSRLAMRARRSAGTATAAMIPMIATTISSSISVKPWFRRGVDMVRLSSLVDLSDGRVLNNIVRLRVAAGHQVGAAAPAQVTGRAPG